MKKRLKKIIVISIIIIILSIIVIFFYSSKISPRLLEYAKIESKKIGIDIISKDVSNEIINILKENSIFDIEKDNQGNIELINYNTEIVNKVLSSASMIVTNNFKEIEENNDGIIANIPIGIITNNVFLENLGPKVPVRLNLNGNVLTSLKTDIKSYGYNSALIQISIRIEANVMILVPLKSEEISIINEVPISIKIIEGNVSSLLSTNN